MARKPDRFERLVETELKGGMRDTMPIAEFRHLAGLLLRRQHRAYVRMVKDGYTHWSIIASNKGGNPGVITYAHYRAVQCREIITLLENYKY